MISGVGKFLFVVPHIVILLGVFRSLVGKFLFWLLTSSVAFHNGVWLWVMLYKFPRRSPG